jgi:hypothetical protein
MAAKPAAAPSRAELMARLAATTDPCERYTLAKLINALPG